MSPPNPKLNVLPDKKTNLLCKEYFITLVYYQ